MAPISIKKQQDSLRTTAKIVLVRLNSVYDLSALIPAMTPEADGAWDETRFTSDLAAAADWEIVIDEPQNLATGCRRNAASSFRPNRPG